MKFFSIKIQLILNLVTLGFLSWGLYSLLEVGLWLSIWSKSENFQDVTVPSVDLVMLCMLIAIVVCLINIVVLVRNILNK